MKWIRLLVALTSGGLFLVAAALCRYTVVTEAATLAYCLDATHSFFPEPVFSYLRIMRSWGIELSVIWLMASLAMVPANRRPFGNAVYIFLLLAVVQLGLAIVSFRSFTETTARCMERLRQQKSTQSPRR